VLGCFVPFVFWKAEVGGKEGDEAGGDHGKGDAIGDEGVSPRPLATVLPEVDEGGEGKVASIFSDWSARGTGWAFFMGPMCHAFKMTSGMRRRLRRQ